MSYDVYFKAKLEGVDQWVYVGSDWISHTTNTGNMIKEVCGSYPPQWNGKKCSEMYPVLIHGISLLTLAPQKYRLLEPECSYSEVETTIDFLKRIADNCDKYPTAIIEVSY